MDVLPIPIAVIRKTHFFDGGSWAILFYTTKRPPESAINIKNGDDMNTTDRNAADSDRIAQNASTRYLYGIDVIDGAERIFCAVIIAFSIMCCAVFATVSNWF